jgi:hypothetical protein
MGHRNSAAVREKAMNLCNHYSESGCKEGRFHATEGWFENCEKQKACMV